MILTKQEIDDIINLGSDDFSIIWSRASQVLQISDERGKTFSAHINGEYDGDDFVPSDDEVAFDEVN
jgi:hypothetical protein